jgi:hypothetical protein
MGCCPRWVGPSLFTVFLVLVHSPQASVEESLSAREPHAVPVFQRRSNESRFERRGEFDPGRGGAYGLAVNSDATRLYVVGESSWLDILDVSNPSAIRSIAQRHFDGMPYGADDEYGIAYDFHFGRLAIGGGPGSNVYLIAAGDDQLSLLDAAYPPDLQFPGLDFPPLIATPPVFIKQGTAIALAMMTAGYAEDLSSGEKVYFGEGVALLSIDPTTNRMSVLDEGIGGLSTIHRQLYDPARDLLWCGGREGSEAILDFSGGPVSQFRYWSYSSGEEGPRVMPDLITRDGKWLIERTASRFPASDWSIRTRQIEATDATYSLWNVYMPTDGSSPHMLGSPPANWVIGNVVSPTHAPSAPLLPCIFTHDETCIITAEVGGSELLILDVSDKIASPQLLFTVDVGEGEQIQSIRGHRNRFYISLKSGRVLVYEWDYVQAPNPPSTLSALPSSFSQDITLSWNPPFGGVPPAGYNVYRRTSSSAFEKVASVNETAWTDDRTSEETTYIYTVKSFAPRNGPIESDESPEAQATTATAIPPKKVLGLSAEATLGGISLTWQPNPESDVIGYLVYRKSGDVPFAKITPSALTDSRYLDLNLDPDVECSYCVTALDANLEGAPSDTVSLAAADRTPSLLQNPGAEEQSLRCWSNASTTISPDSANRYSFDNDLFIAVTNAWSVEGQWAFWGDRTSGKYDRQTATIVDETYLLAAYQDVDLSAFSAAIDSPDKTIVADWGGQVIRTTAEQSAIPSIAIEFLDAGEGILGRYELSSETTGQWVKLLSTDRLPAGTTSVRFWMFAPQVTDSAVNAAWDDLYLILREEQPPQAPNVAVGRNTSGVSVSFGPTASGGTYQIEYADDLLPGTTGWKPCGPPFIGNGGSVEWLDSSSEQTNPTNPPAPAAKHRFYRVSVAP